MLLTDIGSQFFSVQGLSAEGGIQALQDCIMAAVQQTYDKVKPFKQPHHKPFFDAECQEARRQYKEAKRDPYSHAAKVFLKQFKATVRRKKAIHKTRSS